VAFLCLGAVQMVGDNFEGGFSWATLGLVLLVLGFVRRHSEARSFRRAVEDRHFSGTVTEQGITLSDATSETLFGWAAFERLEIYDRFAIAWLATGSALPLAEEMFDQPAVFQQVLAAAGERISPSRRRHGHRPSSTNAE